MTKKLFIGIDLQAGFLSEAVLATDYVLRVSQFLQSADPEQTVLTRFVNQPDSAFVRYTGWDAMQQEDEANRLFGELENSGLQIIEKSGYTAWIPRIIEKAGLLGAGEIVIFGLDSDACVLKTALDIFEAGLRPVVLADLCQSSAGDERHQQGIILLRSLIGDAQVMDSTAMPNGA